MPRKKRFFSAQNIFYCLGGKMSFKKVTIQNGNEKPEILAFRQCAQEELKKKNNIYIVFLNGTPLKVFLNLDEAIKYKNKLLDDEEQKEGNKNSAGKKPAPRKPD